jgi:substrate-binding family protein/regulatory LuxR family protein
VPELRQAIKQPAVVEGETLHISPEQYEGQECHPLLVCTGDVPAQQVEPLIPWLMMQQTAARTFHLPSADYIWPHVMNPKVHEAREGRLCPEAVDAALAAGQTNKEIAETLGISAKTAGHPVQHLLDKTGARTRTAATVWVVRAPSGAIRLRGD